MRACCFKTNIIYIFNDTDLIFFVTIANRLDLFLRAKKKKKKKKKRKRKKMTTLVCLQTYFLHIFDSCLNVDN